MYNTNTMDGLNVKQDVPLASYTSLGIGGPAKYFIEVKDTETLIKAIKIAQEENIPYLVIGSGSNLLVSDEGFSGLIIKNEISYIKNEGENLIVGSGTLLQNLVDYTIEHGLDGMSTMKGVPGTIGGAIYGSAGAYGDNIRDYLLKISCFDGKNIISISQKNYATGYQQAVTFGYRDSIFKQNKNLIVLEATFGGFPQVKKEELLAESLQILKKRAEKYSLDTKCPGSLFKNTPVEGLAATTLKLIPPEKIKFGKVPAGYLLEAVGAKGAQLGQIKVAENHGNTFINLGGGTAEDFYRLAKEQARKVKEKFGISLDPEVQLINLPPLET